jgi:hypothetical protein
MAAGSSQGWSEMKVDDGSAVLAEVCDALAAGQPTRACDILRERYPFASLTKTARKPTARGSVRLFIRDGFIDRYSGTRLVFPGTLRLISKRLPEHFPYQSSWRLDSCHIGYWELFPTIDHILPVSRNGADDESNCVTTSMVRNAAKANFTLEELGWTLFPPGDRTKWDGLMGWFVTQAKADPTILVDPYLKQWFAAANAKPT